MPTSMDRRTFLELVSAVAAAHAAGPVASQAVTDSRDRDASGQRIVVLGAGLAGLACAYNLMKHGYEVVVLEAQNRPGGRVLTVRDGFQDGGYAEMGAIRIFDTHEHTQRYVAEFGLELVPLTDTGSQACYLQGKRFLAPAPSEPWPLDGLHASELPDPSARIPDYVLSGFEKVGDALGPLWPEDSETALSLDPLTVGDYMAAQGASDAWRRWFFSREGYIDRMNALAAFTVESLSEHSAVTSIRGGNDALPRAFADALGERVKYESPVVRLTQRRSHVSVGFLDGTGLHEIEAKLCVCALPFAPLRNVEMPNAFSDEKMAAIRGLNYMASARCCFQTASQFWKQDELGELGGLNMIATDTMAGRVWNLSMTQPRQSSGMLHSYMFDIEALRFTSLGARERVGTLTELMTTILPGLRPELIAVAQKAWQEDPWQGGAWGWAPPGELKWMYAAMRRAEGRVHFAGEHTSPWIAWMNGALESAERVVSEILQR